MDFGIIFSIACIGSLVALCNAKASNSNEPNNSKPATSLPPNAHGSYNHYALGRN